MDEYGELFIDDILNEIREMYTNYRDIDFRVLIQHLLDSEISTSECLDTFLKFYTIDKLLSFMYKHVPKN